MAIDHHATADDHPPNPAPDLRRRLRRRLLSWFDRHQRDLPWRHTRDPYRIWVSEVMLQQTQVATVVPYFRRFLEAFPSLRSLAAADEQAVLRLWEGLGYYRRARDLYRAARALAARHADDFPDDPAALEGIPGMGRYTVGAVLSQAFDRRLPIVEANSRRVLCRLFAVHEDPARGPTQRRLWRLAERLLPARRVGDFNQALMELGALVCTPARPRCAACPLARDCAARRRGLQDAIPFRPAPPEPTSTREVGIAAFRGARVLVVQRPPEGRWAGLWEFPHAPVRAGEAQVAAATRAFAELTGVPVTLGPEILTVHHAVNQHRITLACFEAVAGRGRFSSPFYPRAAWTDPARLADLPFSVPQRRVARLLAGRRQRRLFSNERA